MLLSLKFTVETRNEICVYAIKNNDGVLTCSLCVEVYGRKRIKSGEKTISGKKAQAYIMRIDKVGLHDMAGVYGPDAPISEISFRNTIEYETDDGRKKKIVMNGVEPRLVELIEEVLYKIFPEYRFVNAREVVSVLLKYEGPLTGNGRSAFRQKESLLLDRDENCAVYTIEDNDMLTEHRYSFFSVSLGSLLDKRSDFLMELADSGSQREIPKDGTRSVFIDFTLRSGESYSIRRNYTRASLPAEWADFMGELADFIKVINLNGDLINPGLYGHGKKRNELVYCRTEFEPGGNTYWYRTDDDAVLENSFVVVPVGEFGKRKIGRVVGIEYYTKAKVPHPVEQTRQIIRVLGPDEIGVNANAICPCMGNVKISAAQCLKNRKEWETEDGLACEGCRNCEYIDKPFK